LTKENSPRRIQSASKKVHRQLPHIGPQRGGIVHSRESVQIRYEIVGLTLLLKLDRRLHHAEIISQVKGSRMLNAGKNTHPA
jgi:hypothetical protein